MRRGFSLGIVGLLAIAGIVGACSGGGDTGTGGTGAATAGHGPGGGTTGGTGGTSTGGSGGITGGTGGTGGSGGTGATGGSGGTGATGGGGPVPSGWLYTQPGDNQIYLSDGQSGSVWMGRGVHFDDLFLCGYNTGLWMSNPDGEQALLEVASNMMADWQPTFVRVSLGMNSYDPVVSWIGSSTYKTAMTNVINAIGAHAGTYVLVTLRSDTTMVDTNGNTCGQGDDAVCLPSNASDAVYEELVTSFQNDGYVLFGIANEPGGMSATDQHLSQLMAHAVGVIRAKEDSLGVPHHIVSVQGNQWTSRIGFYDGAPLAYDNVVYEYHSYPPEATGNNGYTQANIPVIIGEYGPSGADLSFLTGFYADVEAKHIPNLAWTLSPFSNCAPDLVAANQNTTLTPTAWGTAVQSYLLAH